MWKFRWKGKEVAKEEEEKKKKLLQFFFQKSVLESNVEMKKRKDLFLSYLLVFNLPQALVKQV